MLRSRSDDPAGDRLGYADFSRAIASALSDANPHDGLVVAIHGPWGSGKSTVLNFVEFVLAADQSEIVRFNPWWSSGQEALTRNFLIQLALALEKRQILGSSLVKGVSDFAEEENPGPHDPDAYRSGILPQLARVSLPQMMRVTGSTSGYCWKIRRGERIPHPMYWESLLALVEGRT